MDQRIEGINLEGRREDTQNRVGHTGPQKATHKLREKKISPGKNSYAEEFEVFI
jgi:hypothetical protein